MIDVPKISYASYSEAADSPRDVSTGAAGF
jgi:hypothetical protein